MTVKSKVKELIHNLGIENAKYLIDEVLIILNDYNVDDVKDWEKVKEEIDKI